MLNLVQKIQDDRKNLTEFDKDIYFTGKKSKTLLQHPSCPNLNTELVKLVY